MPLQLAAKKIVPQGSSGGYPHDLKGQDIYCCGTLLAGKQNTDDLRKELVAHVR